MRKVKWGVIGAGGIADRRTLPGMMVSQNCELVALMEVNTELAQALAEKYHAKRYYTSAEDLLADPEVEAVYIASPVKFHKDQVIAAAKAGKHVLCEKPIAVQLSDSAAAKAACDEQGVLAAAGFMMRYHSLHRKMRELVACGKLGQIVSCRAQMNCWFPDIPGNWRQELRNTGGGALMDMGIHCIDLLEYILGDRCQSVMAMCDTKTFQYDIEDSANVMLKFQKGAVAYVDTNYNIPDDAVTCRLEIMGTKGSMIAENTISQVESGTLSCRFIDQSGYNALQNRTETEVAEYQPEEGNMYAKELDSFSRSILENAPAEVPMADAIHVQKVIETAYASSREGKLLNI